MKLLSLQRGKSNEDIDLCCLKQLSCSTTPEIATKYSIFKTRHSPRFVVTWHTYVKALLATKQRDLSTYSVGKSNVTLKCVPIWSQHFMVLSSNMSFLDIWITPIGQNKYNEITR